MGNPIESAEHEQRLAEALAEMTAELRNGRQPDLEAFARRYPEVGDELRQLWGTALLAQEFVGSAADAATPAPAADKHPVPVTPARSFGDFEIENELGRGGMGVVYKARQRSLNRTVAIKMILRGDLAAPTDLSRFRVEAEAAARLQHPNIVSVYEVGDVGGQPYFSMRYVDGTTLARRLAEGPLPPREAAQCLLAICAAVQHAHDNGILHRDLKPSNILLDGEGRPLVTDFGLAKPVAARQSLTRSGAIVGTPSYMAPEQAAGSQGSLTPATDVYSLGSILYEMLTGRPPFQAPSTVDTLMLVLEQEPVPPRLLNPRVDRDLEMICLKCLQKPADLRYPTAADLAADLQKFLNGEPITSGLGYFFSRILRETHHAAVLENWGLLWMWHSLVLLVLCFATGIMHLRGIANPLAYVCLWGIGLSVWGSIFWALRRRGGPVTFVERQIGHAWVASTAGSMGLFLVEWLLGLPVLTLSPALALMGGMVFVIKAGTLSGSFYLSAAACFATAVVMACFPAWGLFVFGIVSAACFFIPGWKYYRQRLQSLQPTDASDLGLKSNS